MNKNNIFSVKRCFLLLKKEFKENGRVMLYSFIAIAILIALFEFYPVISKKEQYSQNDMALLYFFGLFIIGLASANFAFSSLGHKPYAISSLTLPASALEKLTAKYFIYTILFIVLYSFCFWLLNKFAVYTYISGLVTKNPDRYIYRQMERTVTDDFNITWYAFFTIQLIFYIGAIHFKRYSYLLSMLISLVMFILFASYFTKIPFSLSSIDPEKNMIRIKNNQLYILDIKHTIPYYKLYLLPTWLIIIKNLITCVGIPFLFVIAWFKLKERDIK